MDIFYEINFTGEKTKTDTSQTSGTDAPPMLKPLPQLPVLRETYCSQEMTDACIKYLEEKRPDLLQSLLFEEGFLRDHSYFKVLGKIVSFMLQQSDKSIPLPLGHMGMIDFVSELSRRLRAAHDFPEIKPLGKSLAPHLDGPFPPLISMKIGPYAKKRGLTQEVADRILRLLYQQMPDLWFAMAEGVRHSLHGIYTLSDDFFEAVNRVAAEENIPLTDAMVPSDGWL